MSNLSTTNSTASRFWVIGGEYSCLAFERLIEGTEKVAGPFFHRSAAEAVWRRLSETAAGRRCATPLSRRAAGPPDPTRCLVRGPPERALAPG